MMETFARASPGDCQAADSTTPATTTAETAINNPVSSSQEQRATSSSSSSSTANHSEDVSSTTTTTTAAAKSTTPPTSTRKLGSSPPPAMTVMAVGSNNNNNNNNNNSNSGGNNKLKPQLQQQQQQQNATQIKVHQFRAPQQFAKHKKATSMVAKKNKTWNKRQNKCHPHKQQLLQQQQQQQQQGAGNGLPAGGAGIGLGLAAAVGGGSLPATKADLENIQNIKNQLGSGGGGGHHHQYYHHHGGHHGGRGGGGNTGNGIASCSCSLEKLGYGHGHLKQQLYRKMLAHRGHHHHVLCPGAAHNASGGGNPVCCLANGCTVQNGKDSVGLNSHNNSSHSNVTHYCCGRSKFFLPEKRPRKEVIIPPTKFLLGGTISDPLNLNSLQNENASSNNNTPATTPRQSPITTPPKVEVIIPPNIYDPLHLLDPVDSMEYEKQLTSPMKRRVKPSAKKHRHRKNRKPKRRRHESYNSTNMEDDALSLGGSVAVSSSSLTNSTLLTEPTSATLNSSMSISMSLASAENTSATGVGVVAEEQRGEECHRDSPAASGGDAVESMLSSSVAEQLEHHIAVGSPKGNQQHVASSAGETSVVNERESLMMRVRRSSERERVSKDLHLDLSLCCGVGGGGGSNNNSSNNINNNSASSSTCGSIATLGSGGGLAGGRKRKISESNNSQKNKKFHRLDSMDKIVSPVVPQPGAWKRPPRLVHTGARKPARRSISVSETELLSPADESSKLTIDSEGNQSETPDISKMECVSPQSTASGATSVAAGEQDSIPDISLGDVIPKTKEKEASVVATGVSSTVAPNTVTQLTKMPKFRPDGAKYQYGNYDRYAGFRHLNEFMDVRLQVFQRHMELFENKDILDIGCNVGHMTITVARSLMPKSILGIDIDKELVARARHNLSMYVRIPPEAKVKQEMKDEGVKAEVVDNKKKKARRQRNKKKQQPQQHPSQHQFSTTNHAHHHYHHHHLLIHHHHHQHHQHSDDAASFFPVSFPISYGGIPEATVAAATPSTSGGTPGNAATSGGSKSKNDFPKNVFFRHANYVLKDETQLNNDSQQYDLIMCLSVTKWIHLNFGDSGLKLAFKRMFNQLRPGGKLILEAQNWASYKKKKNLTEEIYKNYHNIEFFPNKFHEYLLSSDVGFSHSYTLGVPRHFNKGFCRPIQLYAKGDYTPNHVRWSDAYHPQTPYEAYRGIYATMPPRPQPLISSSRSQSYDTPHHPGIGGGGGVAAGSNSSYSCRQTPMHQPTSQYYNPLETDSYLPSYDMEYLNHLYVFASPLYQTVWSPPASLRNSSTHTPLFGSVREAELDGDGSSGGGAGGGSFHRHVYPPNDDTSSPNANAGGAFNSIRDPDTDDSNQLPASSVKHVYATTCESSSSPQVLHAHESLEPIDETLMLADVTDEVGVNDTNNCCGDSNEA